MYLWGHSRVTGRRGERYFLSIIDDFSQKAAVYLLKDKTEVFRTFEHHMTRAESFLECKVKTVWIDNGSEFINENYKRSYEENGIKNELTYVYTPEQDGVLECYN